MARTASGIVKPLFDPLSSLVFSYSATMRPWWLANIFASFSVAVLLVNRVSGLPHVSHLSDHANSENRESLSDHSREARTVNGIIPRNPGVLDGLVFQNVFDIGNGWNMYHSSWPAAILPIQPAAWALTTLYVSVMTHARTSWSTGPPQNSLVSTFGGIRLLMACPQQPIPWQFVAKFAEKLLQITEGGWTGVYSVMLSQAGTDVEIVVELSVLS